MKKIFVFICAVFAAVTAFAAPKYGALVELDGRSSKNYFTGISSPGLKIAPQAKEDGKGELYFLISEKELTDKWQEFTVSFVPADTMVVFGLFASSGHPVDYDDVKVINGSAYNTSFERINSDNEIDGWRYYTPGTVKANAADAADGRVYITCSRDYGMRQAFYMKPGQRAVISFKARIGRELQLPPHNGWASKNIRKMR